MFQGISQIRHAERGAVVVAATAILLLLLIITLGVAIAASQLSSHSRRDTYSSRAFHAAETGLNVARFRINRMSPTGPTQHSCPSGSGTASVPTSAGPNTDCAAAIVDLGAGASATYYVSTAFTTPPPCGGVAPEVDHWARCVTSTGTVNGVSRRVQVRLDASASAGQPVFCSDCGFVGLAGVKLDGSNTINGNIASDGLISLRGSGDTITGYCEPSQPLGSVSAGSNTCQVRTQATTWASRIPSVSALDTNRVSPGGAAEGFADPCTTGYSWTSTSTSYVATTNPCGNQNSTIVSGYTASSRRENLGAGATITLCTTGKVCAYNLCQLDLAAASTINIAAGSRVLMFIDSPARSSSCAGRNGSLTQDAGSAINNAGSPANLQVYVWGNPGASSPTSNVGMMAGSGIHALIFAPNSTFNSPSAGAAITGAITAYSIGGADVSLSFSFDNSAQQPTTGQPTTGRFTPTAGSWHECSASNPGGYPESGC